MKRFVTIALATMMLLTLTLTSAMAGKQATVHADANTWTTGIGYYERTASGSYWKGWYKGCTENCSSIQCYLYRKGGDRCTKIISLNLSSKATTHLNYLSGQAVTGAKYKFVFKGTKNADYTNYFNP
jgi:hypothetical protein